MDSDSNTDSNTDEVRVANETRSSAGSEPSVSDVSTNFGSAAIMRRKSYTHHPLGREEEPSCHKEVALVNLTDQASDEGTDPS